jgi:hypothetical protein
MATIMGTAGDDDLSSSTSGDVILGLGGMDVLAANASGILLDGGADDDQLFSFVGDSTLIGGAGSDFLLGLGDNETASYAGAAAGVTADLSVSAAIDDGDGSSDVLIDIENVTGSAFADNLAGDFDANVLTGGSGDDVLAGGGGADVFHYSFDFAAGGGETFAFTDFFTANGGRVVDGEVADGTSQGQFSSLYTKWLEMLVSEHGLGTEVLGIGQNSGAGGMPVIENMTGEFGERESFTWTSGSGKKTVTHERWYSDTWSTGGGEDGVTSNDGLDTIVGFGADDVLDFSGITEEQFQAHFSADSSNGDTVITINGSSNWSLTLADVTLSLSQVADQAVFS